MSGKELREKRCSFISIQYLLQTRSVLHLLIQTLFCRVRVVVQNVFIVTSISGAVVLILKISNLISKVTRYTEGISRVKK